MQEIHLSGEAAQATLDAITTITGQTQVMLAQILTYTSDVAIYGLSSPRGRVERRQISITARQISDAHETLRQVWGLPKPPRRRPVTWGARA